MLSSICNLWRIIGFILHMPETFIMLRTWLLICDLNYKLNFIWLVTIRFLIRVLALPSENMRCNKWVALPFLSNPTIFTQKQFPPRWRRATLPLRPKMRLLSTLIVRSRTRAVKRTWSSQITTCFHFQIRPNQLWNRLARAQISLSLCIIKCYSPTEPFDGKLLGTKW